MTTFVQKRVILGQPGPVGPAGPAGPTLTGNTLWVDSVFGNDGTAVREDLSKPYLTLQAAVAAAIAGDGIFCRPGSYILTAGLVIPNGVTLTALNGGGVHIHMHDVVVDTTLITMGENSRLTDVDIHLTSAQHHTLTGLFFGGTTGVTARAINVRLHVDNSTAGAGNSIATGVLIQSTGGPGLVDALANCIIEVDSIGTGRKRGILSNVAVGEFFVTDTNTRCESVGSVDCVGVEIDIAGGLLNYLTGVIAQSPAAPAANNGDISQTAGTLEIGAVSLRQGSCRLRNFSYIAASGILTWADIGAVPDGVRFMRLGTAQVTAVEADAQIRIARKTIIKTLSVHLGVAPGAGETCTITARKNGVSTLLSVVISDAGVSQLDLVNAIELDDGDYLSMLIQDSAGGSSQDPNVTVEVI